MHQFKSPLSASIIKIRIARIECVAYIGAIILTVDTYFQVIAIILGVPGRSIQGATGIKNDLIAIFFIHMEGEISQLLNGT